MKVSDLEGRLLDFWVLKAEGKHATYIAPCKDWPRGTIFITGERACEECCSNSQAHPSTQWFSGGLLIAHYRINLRPIEPGAFLASRGRITEPAWLASCPHQTFAVLGRTPLEAVCRAVVEHKFGMTVPDDLHAEGVA